MSQNQTPKKNKLFTSIIGTLLTIEETPQSTNNNVDTSNNKNVFIDQNNQSGQNNQNTFLQSNNNFVGINQNISTFNNFSITDFNKLSDDEKQKIKEKFDQIYEKLNDPMPSYHEYRNLLSNLKLHIIGNAAYTVALTSLESITKTKIDKNLIISNIDSITAALNIEKTNVNNAGVKKISDLQIQFEKSKKDLNDNVNKIDNDINNLQNQIKTLQLQIENLQTQKEKIVPKIRNIDDELQLQINLSELRKNYFIYLFDEKLKTIQEDKTVLLTI